MGKQVGVKCTRGFILHQDCRACSQKPNHPCPYPPDVLERMREENETEPSMDAFSPTRLTDCDRKQALMLQNEWYVDVESQWPLIRGTLLHAGMESAKGNASYPGALGVIREFRFSTKIKTKYGEYDFTGKPDNIVILNLAQTEEEIHIKIVDYKTKGNVDYHLDSAMPEHQLQVNLYGYLATKCLPESLGKPDLKVVVDELEIFYAGYNKPRRFTSAGPLIAKGKRLTKPIRYEELELKPVVRYSMDAMERWITRKIEAKIRSREELPPILEGDAAWVCEYCQVREICYARG
jgi:hypothetical protein